MRRITKCILIAVLAIAFCGAAWAETTIDVFSMLSNYAGEQTGWFAKVLKDKLDIKLNIIASNLEGGETKIATMMASGNLGDLVLFGDDGQNFRDSITGGLLLDWTKNGLLDTYGANLKKDFAKALEKNRVNFGGGTAVYGIGHAAANMPKGPMEGIEMTYQSDLRWDLYRKLGSPKVKTMEDLLPILKQMQQAEPKSDSGRPTYAFSMWADWDGNLMMVAKQFACMYGYDESDNLHPGGFLLVSADKSEYQDFLDPKGLYVRTLKLYFKANQMGLVDPDSLTQKFEDVVSKYRDGQVLFCWFPWLDQAYNTPERQAQGKGFRMVPMADMRVYSYGFNPYGGNRVTTIGSKTKNAAKVMQLIDWLYTPEGVQTAFNGPQGLTWDLKSGKPYLTDFGKKALPNNPIDVPEKFGGGNWKDGMNQINNQWVQESAINPGTKEPYDWHLWTSTLNDNPTALVSDWRKAYGALTPKDYLVKNKMIAVSTPLFTGKAPDVMSDELQQKRAQAGLVIRTYSWRLVFAKDEAEFASLLDEMTTKAKGMGYDDVVKWNADHAKIAFQYRK